MNRTGTDALWDRTRNLLERATPKIWYRAHAVEQPGKPARHEECSQNMAGNGTPPIFLAPTNRGLAQLGLHTTNRHFQSSSNNHNKQATGLGQVATNAVDSIQHSRHTGTTQHLKC